jgi:hypothetical protein
MPERSEYDIKFNVKLDDTQFTKKILGDITPQFERLKNTVNAFVTDMDGTFKRSRGIADVTKQVDELKNKLQVKRADLELPRFFQDFERIVGESLHGIDKTYRETDTFKEIEKDIISLRKTIDVAVNRLQGVDTSFRRFGDNASSVRSKILQFQAALEGLKRTGEGTIFFGINKEELENDLKDAEKNLRFLENKKYRVRIEVEESALRVLRNLPVIFNRSGRAAQVLSTELRTLYLQIGVLGRFMVIALFVLSPLLSSLVALGSSLVSVASAAALAGAALGGALAAGAAQALPVIGLLANAMSKLKNILDLIKKEDTQAATAGARGEDLDARRRAAQQLVQAQQSLANATRELAKARRDARRDLEDLIIAEKRARLEAEGAVVSQIRAGQTLREAIRGGDVLSIREAQIGVEGAGLDVQSSRLNQQRTTGELAAAQAAGVEGSERVLDAQRALQAATFGLADAQKQAADAAKGQATANAALAGQLEKLTPVEKNLKAAIQRLQGAFKQVFGPITDIILSAFTDIANGITKIIKDPEIATGFRSLATGIAGALRELFAVLASPENIRLFKDTLRESGRNLPLVARAFANVLVIIGNVVRAATPLVRPLLETFVKWTDKMRVATGDTQKLGSNFLTWGVYLHAFLRLGESLLGLLKDIILVAGPAGLKLVKFVTDQVDSLRQFITENPERAREFFNNMADAAIAVLDVIIEIAKFLSGMVEAGLVEDMAHVFTEILLPAFENASKVVHSFVKILAALANVPVISTILKWTATFMLLITVLITMTSALRGPLALWGFFFSPNAVTGVTRAGQIYKALGPIFQSIGSAAMVAGRAIAGLSLTAGIWIAVIAAVVIGLIVLEKKFGVVSKAIDGLKVAAKAVWDWLKDNWDKLVAILLGPFGLAFLLIKKYWTEILDFFKDLPGNIAEFFTDLYHTLTSPFIDAAKTIKNVIGDAFKFVKNTFGTGLSGIGDVIKTAFNGAVGVAETAVHGIYSAIRFLWNGIADIWEPIKDAINTASPFDDLPSIPKLGEWKSTSPTQASPDSTGRIAARRLATGGEVPARPGGTGYILGEGGFKEYVLSTDPKYKGRTADLLAKFLKEKSFQAGGVVYESMEDFWKRFTGKSLNDPSVRGLLPFKNQWYQQYRKEKQTAPQGTTGGFGAGTPTGPSSGHGIDAAYAFAVEQIGDRYSQRQRLGPDSWDCSGYAGKVASFVEGYTGGVGGWTGKYFPMSKPAKGNEPVLWGFRGNPQSQNAGHMGIRVKGRWFDAGSGGVQSDAGSRHWRWLRIPPGLEYLSRGLAAGGELEGSEGKPQLILAHSGEMILNREQQNKLGGAEYLRNLLGFKRGGGSSFQAGGIVSSDFTSAQAEVTKASSILRRLGIARNLRPTLDGFVNVFTALTASIQEGMKVLTDEISKLKDNVDKKIKIATVSVTTAASGEIQVTEASPVDVANLQVAGTEQQIGALQTQQKTNDSVLAAAINAENSARARLARLRQIQKVNPKAVTPAMLSNATKALQLAIGFRKQAEQQKIDIGANIAQAGSDLLVAQQERRDAIINAALNVGANAAGVGGAQERLATIDKRQQIAQILGRGNASEFIGQKLGVLVEQRFALADQLLKAGSDEKLRAQIQAAIDDLDVSIAQATVDKFDAIQAELLKPSNAKLAMASVQMSIAQISGPGFSQDRGAVEAAFGARGSALADQRKVLQDLLAAATSQNLPDKVADLTLQLAENELATLENNKALYDFKNDISFALRDSSNAISMAGVQISIAQISGAGFGVNRGALQSALNAMGSALSEQRNVLEGLLSTALDPQVIAELNLQLAQNELATLENSKALYDLKTDIGYYLQPSNAKLAILGVQQQIAQISGPGFTPDQSQLIQINKDVRTQLLAQQKIMNNMLRQVRGDPVKLADLQLQLKQNELALLQNSKELAELNGQMNIQNFTSKPWEAFRLAIFSGAGKILPQFNIPQITGGAIAETSGISTPPPSVGKGSGKHGRYRDHNENTVINITEPTEVVDPVYMASRLSWEKKNRR